MHAVTLRKKEVPHDCSKTYPFYTLHYDAVSARSGGMASPIDELISGLLEPISYDPEYRLSYNEMMQVIYSSSSEEAPLWILAGDGEPELFMSQGVRSYSIIFEFPNQAIVCHAHHRFDFRWTGTFCEELIDSDEIGLVIVYDGVSNSNLLFNCSSIHKVNYGSITASHEHLYQCHKVHKLASG